METIEHVLSLITFLACFAFFFQSDLPNRMQLSLLFLVLLSFVALATVSAQGPCLEHRDCSRCVEVSILLPQIILNMNTSGSGLWVV